MESSMGERIKTARERKGIFQEQLAQLIGVKSAGVISNWENNKNKPDADKIVKLCQVLDITPSYILDYNAEIEKAPTAMRQEPVSMDDTNSLLVALGYIKQGEDLSDGDLAFLTHVVGLLDAWFGAKQK